MPVLRFGWLGRRRWNKWSLLWLFCAAFRNSLSKFLTAMQCYREWQFSISWWDFSWVSVQASLNRPKRSSQRKDTATLPLKIKLTQIFHIKTLHWSMTFFCMEFCGNCHSWDHIHICGPTARIKKLGKKKKGCRDSERWVEEKVWFCCFWCISVEFINQGFCSLAVKYMQLLTFIDI